MTGLGDSWSRRKAAVAEEDRARDEAAEEDRAEAARRALDEKPDAEALAELNLPDPDTLGQGDDFSAFMAKAVPDRLRRRALRRLWISNPALANLDELVDYGEDFTDAATVVEHLQTAYRVGKGMLGRLQDGEEAGETDEAGEVDAPPPAADAADEAVDEDGGGARAEPTVVEPAAGRLDAGGGARAEPTEAEAAAGPPEAPPVPDGVEAEARPRRHMRFTFADADVGRTNEAAAR